MALCQAHAVFITQKLRVEVCRLLQLQRTLQKNLSRRRLQQIGSTNDLVNLHVGIVHHAGKLIAG